MKIRMKSTILILLLAISCTTLAQKPKWLKKKFRDSEYSQEVYLKGYSYDEKRSSEGIAQAIERVKSLAKGEIAQNLISEIQTDHTLSTVERGDSITQSFEMNILSEAKAEIYGMTAEGYYDKGDKMVYGFAFAKRDDVVQFYKTNIDKHMQSISSIIATAKNLVKKGDLVNAESEFRKTKPFFVKITYASDFIVLIKSVPLDIQYTTAIRDLEYEVKRQLENIQTLKNEQLYLLEYNYKTYYILPDDLNGTYTWFQAVNTCKDLVAFDNDDWVVPSKNVLNEMFAHKNEIKGFKSNGAYWSSSEKENKAWGRQFSEQGVSGYGNKDGYARVRCIREKK